MRIATGPGKSKGSMIYVSMFEATFLVSPAKAFPL